MKWLIIAAIIVLTLTSSGCMTIGYLETHIQFHGEKEPATVTIVYGDISSSEELLEDVQGTFESLVDDWKGDKYLLDRADEGFFVKSRAVFIEEGQIVARVMGITKDVEEFHPMWVSNGERIMLIEAESDVEIVESNGKIFNTDNNTLIVWPEDTPTLYIKHRMTELDESHAKNRAIMVKMLEEYLAKTK